MEVSYLNQNIAKRQCERALDRRILTGRGLIRCQDFIQAPRNLVGRK